MPERLPANVHVLSSPCMMWLDRAWHKWPWTFTLTSQKLTVTFGTCAHICAKFHENRSCTFGDIGLGLGVEAQSTSGGKTFLPEKYVWTRNSLDCGQSNYSSRIVFSDIPFEFGQTGISTIRIIHSADIATWIFQDGRRAAILDLAKPEIAPFDPPTRKPYRRTKHEVDRTNPRRDMTIWIFPNVRSLVVGRRSDLNIYFFLHWSHILLFATLGT